MLDHLSETLANRPSINCVKCGYRLFASQFECPECGTSQIDSLARIKSNLRIASERREELARLRAKFLFLAHMSTYVCLIMTTYVTVYVTIMDFCLKNSDPSSIFAISIAGLLLLLINVLLSAEHVVANRFLLVVVLAALFCGTAVTYHLPSRVQIILSSRYFEQSAIMSSSTLDPAPASRLPFGASILGVERRKERIRVLTAVYEDGFVGVEAIVDSNMSSALTWRRYESGRLGD